MSDKTVWLIHFEASLGENSPMNRDGSPWLTAIGVVQGDGANQAQEILTQFLTTQKMGLMKVFDVTQYVPEQYTEQSSKNEHINQAVKQAHLSHKPILIDVHTAKYFDVPDFGAKDA